MKSTWKISAALLLMSASVAIGSAQTKTPQIDTINPLTQDASPVVAILGKGFGKDASAVKVIINDTSTLAQIISVKNKKLIVQIPGNSLCTGNVSLRVLVNTTNSNAAKFEYYKGLPSVMSLQPQQASTGSLIEVVGDNLSCDTTNNVVTFNNLKAEILGTSDNKLFVKVPDQLAAGQVDVRVAVAGHVSLAKTFIVDSNAGGGGVNTEDRYLFKNTGQPMAAGFAPIFNINDKLNVNGYDTNLWYVNFYGTHQAIVDAPWKTINGQQQKALVTIDSRYNFFNSASGRYFYVLVQYPKHPELAFDAVNNYFFWGSFALISEGSPHGDVGFNSAGRGGAGVESFEISKTLSTQNKFSFTAIVIAPDLGGYEDYGRNYAQAGNGKVSMPKLAKLTMEFNNIEARVPIAYYNLGNVTMTDMSGQYGAISTANTEFKAKLDANDITFFYPFF